MAFLKYRGNTTTPNKPVATIAADAPLTNSDIDGNFASLNHYKLENNGYTSGDIVYAGLDGVLTNLAKSTDGKYLTLASGVPAWADAIATELLTPRDIAITGDLAYTVSFDGSQNVTAIGTLATVNTNVGQFGSATAIPVVTVNAKGLVTAVTTANVSSTLPITGDTGTDSVSLLTDTLNFAGGTGLTSIVTNNTVTFDIDSTVATLTGTQTLTNKTLSGSDNTFSNIPNSALSNSGVTADTYNNVAVNSKGIVTSGSNVAYLTVESDTLDSVTARGASTDSAISITNLIDSTSITTGALVVDGGVGIGKKLTVGGNAAFEGAVQIDGNLVVSGTTTTIDATNLAVADNMIYLNDGSTVTNPDLGFAGNYNDGTYAHTGLFRDASDGTWKFYEGYTLEPDASVYIDTAHPSFQLADLQVNKLTASLVEAVEVIATQDLNANIVYITTNNYEAFHQGNTKTIGGQSLFGTGNIDAGANLTDDTSTDASYYLGMSTGVSGSWTSAYVSSTKLYFNPSTGQLNASNFNSLSDKNLKTNILNIDNAPLIIDMLQGVSYDWLDGSGSGYGFIAQDIEKVLAHSVSTNEHGIKTVNYSSVIPFLVEAVKLLQKKVQELESK
jgi:hypothetical protein